MFIREIESLNMREVYSRFLKLPASSPRRQALFLSKNRFNPKTRLNRPILPIKGSVIKRQFKNLNTIPFFYFLSTIKREDLIPFYISKIHTIHKQGYLAAITLYYSSAYFNHKTSHVIDDIFDRMIFMNGPQDRTMFNCMIKGHSIVNDIEKVEFYFDKLVSNGLTPSAKTFSKLIKSYSLVKNTEMVKMYIETAKVSTRSREQKVLFDTFLNSKKDRKSNSKKRRITTSSTNKESPIVSAIFKPKKSKSHLKKVRRLNQVKIRKSKFEKANFSWNILPDNTTVVPIDQQLRLVILCDGSGSKENEFGGAATFISLIQPSLSCPTVAKLGIQIPSPSTTYLNEFFAIFQAFHYISDLPQEFNAINEIVFQTDSRSVIHGLFSKEIAVCPLAKKGQEYLKNLSKRFSQTKFVVGWIPRLENSVADGMAGKARKGDFTAFDNKGLVTPKMLDLVKFAQENKLGSLRKKRSPATGVTKTKKKLGKKVLRYKYNEKKKRSKQLMDSPSSLDPIENEISKFKSMKSEEFVINDLQILKDLYLQFFNRFISKRTIVPSNPIYPPHFDSPDISKVKLLENENVSNVLKIFVEDNFGAMFIGKVFYQSTVSYGVRPIVIDGFFNDYYENECEISLVKVNFFLKKLLSNFRGTIYEFNSIIFLYSMKNCPKMIEFYFEKMKTVGVAPDAKTFEILIDFYATQKNHDLLLHTLRKFFNSKLDLTSTTAYNSKIQAYSLLNKSLATSAFDEMDKNSITPSQRTFCLALDHFSKSGSVARAQRIFSKMKTQDAFAYHKLLQNFILLNLDQDIKTTWQKMMTKNVKPLLVTCNVLIEFWNRDPKNKRTFNSLVQDIKSCNVKFDSQTYFLLINNLHTTNFMEKDSNQLSNDYYNEMLKNSIEPNVCIYTLLIKIALKSNDPIGASFYFDKFFHSNPKLVYEHFREILRFCPRFTVKIPQNEIESMAGMVFVDDPELANKKKYIYKRVVSITKSSVDIVNQPIIQKSNGVVITQPEISHSPIIPISVSSIISNFEDVDKQLINFSDFNQRIDFIDFHKLIGFYSSQKVIDNMGIDKSLSLAENIFFKETHPSITDQINLFNKINSFIKSLPIQSNTPKSSDTFAFNLFLKLFIGKTRPFCTIFLPADRKLTKSELSTIQFYYTKMKQHKIQPDITTYSLLIIASVMGETYLPEVAKYFMDMKNEKVKPTALVYGFVVARLLGSEGKEDFGMMKKYYEELLLCEDVGELREFGDLKFKVGEVMGRKKLPVII